MPTVQVEVRFSRCPFSRPLCWRCPVSLSQVVSWILYFGGQKTYEARLTADMVGLRHREMARRGWSFNASEQTASSYDEALSC